MDIYNITDLMAEYKAPCLTKSQVVKDFIKDKWGKKLAKIELFKRLEAKIEIYKNNWFNEYTLKSTYTNLINCI